MLSKNKIKLIQSLNRKKKRDETGLFLVEGNKMVEEALRSEFQVELLVCTPTFLDQNSAISGFANELIETDIESLHKASLMQNPQDALALVRQPLNSKPELNLNHDLVLALDFIQDPGNLGTIFRIADWFGISSIICSENTVDSFNPKVVQASMGSIFRIKTWYIEIEDFLGDAKRKQIPIYGTFLDGQNIYTEALTKNGVIIMGNEGNGISKEAGQFVSNRLFIPSFSTNEIKTESLNVAIATAICCSEFRKR